MSTRQGFQRLNASQCAAWLAKHPQAQVLMREPKDRPVFIYCYHGNASQTYAEMFADFGFATVFDLIGGWDGWQKSSTPFSHPPGDQDGPRL
jgi:rhodanese-related sulfurtransferase